ncbi:hypothetical protein Kpol_1018p147 [Vanderwaltozyma polyspora DSM 70294]|uniref:Uncharacterized protein n=1 Tax=Vanderwaltozyma polyspora (strain ATCC 22028 / DSM 70294 / BCRC 21397 / CBS 2163 / NBRC 10782 / NRRL Y-8283 / UCD 57-17) TaxID=436907 RepID=A7TDY9_VANPO|nr:uncharacterized protein Kpol_1018p147 [Vanderwaltozyma polyspora DSM 70294]EDO19609.1 hypothetical protein Kpol_1018p147 [Vanderwaltozyma polyspora DSM 70294]
MFRLNSLRGINRRLVDVSTKRLFSNARPRLNKLSTSAESQLLTAQRGNRPISPHLTIYQPQLTWYLSSVHRVSCIALGACFYLVTISFGLSSLLGLGLTADSFANWYNSWSSTSQSLVKGAFSYLFAFQFTLSIRHFMWDMGKGLSLSGVYRSGYTAMAVATALGTYLWL